MVASRDVDLARLGQFMTNLPQRPHILCIQECTAPDLAELQIGLTYMTFWEQGHVNEFSSCVAVRKSSRAKVNRVMSRSSLTTGPQQHRQRLSSQ